MSDRRAARAATVLLTTLLGVLAHLAATAPAAQAAPVLRAERSYGAGPVVMTSPRERVLLDFTGKRGDIVTLGVSRGQARTKVSLRLGSRVVKARWDRYWQLPRSGRYTFAFEQVGSRATKRKLQLQKLRVRPLAADSRRKAAPARRGFLSAVSFTVPRNQRMLLSTPAWAVPVLAADGSTTRALSARDVQLEAGQPVRTAAGFTGTAALRAGRTIALVKAGRPVSLTRSVVASMQVGGGADTITPPDALPREWVYDFHAMQGQVVRLDRPIRYGFASWVDAAGESRNSATSRLASLLWVEATGTQRLSVITDSSTSGSLRLDEVPVVGHLPSDGSTATLRTPAAGRWVAMTTDGDATGLAVSAPSFTDASGAASAGWTVYTSTRHPSYCELIWKPALGCGDYSTMSVSGTAGQATSALGTTGDSVVLAVPDGVSGSVAVQLTRAAG